VAPACRRSPAGRSPAPPRTPGRPARRRLSGARTGEPHRASSAARGARAPCGSARAPGGHVPPRPLAALLERRRTQALPVRSTHLIQPLGVQGAADRAVALPRQLGRGLETECGPVVVAAQGVGLPGAGTEQVEPLTADVAPDPLPVGLEAPELAVKRRRPRGHLARQRPPCRLPPWGIRHRPPVVARPLRSGVGRPTRDGHGCLAVGTACVVALCGAR
jgi:hypothetical protein